MQGRATGLADFRPPTRLKLSALWASLMCCFVYGDYFGLYLPGKLAAMGAGQMGPLGAVTPGLLVAVSAMMAVPSLMIALSLLLPATLSRWLNILFALVYAGIMVLTMIGGAPTYYLMFGVIEIALTLAILVHAWTWPRAAAPEAGVDGRV